MERWLVMMLCIVYWCGAAISAAAIVLPPPNTLVTGSQNTTAGSTFQKNVRQVLQFLVATAPLNTSAVYNYGSYPDQVYGLAACFNSTVIICGTCLISNRDRMIEAAPLAVGAELLLANETGSYSCFLRYENFPIISPGPASAPIAPVAKPPVVASSPAPAVATVNSTVTVIPAAPSSNSAQIQTCSFLLILLSISFL